jgi:VanZ family protein
VRYLWLLYLILVYGLSSVPGDPESLHVPAHADKVVHVLLYGGLAYVYLRGDTRRRAGLVGLGKALALVLAAGLVDELYQGMVPHRGQELMDLLADLAGGAAGALLALATARRPCAVREGKR